MCEVLEHSGAPRVQALIEPAARTADRLSRPGSVDLDGWLVTPPWPEAVDSARERAGLTDLFSVAGAPIARSPLVLVVARNESRCFAPTAAGRSGGSASATSPPGMWSDIGGPTDGVESSHGTLPRHGRRPGCSPSVRQLRRGSVEPTCPPSSSTDGTFLDWLTPLESARAEHRRLGRGDAHRAGPVDVLGTTEADAGPQIVTAATPRSRPCSTLNPWQRPTSSWLGSPGAGWRTRCRR